MTINAQPAARLFVGSLLSPHGWAVIAVVFLVVSVVEGTHLVIARDYEHLDGAISAMLLALLSFGAASHFKRQSASKDDRPLNVR